MLRAKFSCSCAQAKYAGLPWDVVFSGELLGSYKPYASFYSRGPSAMTYN